MATYESLLVLSTLVRSFDIKFAEGYVEHIAKTDVDDAVPTPRYAVRAPRALFPLPPVTYPSDRTHYDVVLIFAQNALTLPFLEPFMVTVSRRGGGCRS